MNEYASLTKAPGDCVALKAELLANGVRPTRSFLLAFGPPHLSKRRAYGNPDDLAFRGERLPQELYLLPDRLVCAVNVRSCSDWVLDWSEESGFLVRHGAFSAPVAFPSIPKFYDELLPGRGLARKVVTLYGGGSLGIFVRGECSLVEMGKACQYCSILPNRSRESEFPAVVSGDTLFAALGVALADESCPISQVMINGGNFADPDRSFLYYARLCAAARRALDESRREVELHLIVYPPADLKLIRELQGLNLSVAINLEICDPALFQRYCPGKHTVLGQNHILAALAQAVQALGSGNVFSILVGGMEGQGSMDRGMTLLMNEGVIPIINVFHPDPETPLQAHPAPTASRILEMGRSLQAVFSDTTFARPFYLGCGRNSLDTEAYFGMFRVAAHDMA